MCSSDTSVTAVDTIGPTSAWSPVGLLRRWFAALNARREQRIAMAYLDAMSERELADIGLSRSDIQFAVTRGTARERETRR